MADETTQRGRTSQRPAVDLTDRQRSVLRAVVEDYVLTAIPVGSKALVNRYGLGVSPATVRSAMAELEALGLLSIRTRAPDACPPTSATASTSRRSCARPSSTPPTS